MAPSPWSTTAVAAQSVCPDAPHPVAMYWNEISSDDSQVVSHCCTYQMPVAGQLSLQGKAICGMIGEADLLG